jgi:hypothetical protein
MPLSPQGSLSQRLHHDRCNAEANGCPGRECEERDPHACFPRSVFGSRSLRERAVNAQPEYSFLELFRYINTFFLWNEAAEITRLCPAQPKTAPLTAALPTFDVV